MGGGKEWKGRSREEIGGGRSRGEWGEGRSDERSVGGGGGWMEA